MHEHPHINDANSAMLMLASRLPYLPGVPGQWVETTESSLRGDSACCLFLGCERRNTFTETAKR